MFTPERVDLLAMYPAVKLMQGACNLGQDLANEVFNIQDEGCSRRHMHALPFHCTNIIVTQRSDALSFARSASSVPAIAHHDSAFSFTLNSSARGRPEGSIIFRLGNGKTKSASEGDEAGLFVGSNAILVF